MSTERQMRAGEMYDALDPELVAARARARDLCQHLNAVRWHRSLCCVLLIPSCSSPITRPARGPRCLSSVWPGACGWR